MRISDFLISLKADAAAELKIRTLANALADEMIASHPGLDANQIAILKSGNAQLITNEIMRENNMTSAQVAAAQYNAWAFCPYS